MNLTPVQEEALMMKYDKVLWSAVNHFVNRCSRNYVCACPEDLHSECAIVLLLHIRSCETMEEIEKLPWLDFVNAMCCYLLQQQVLSYPKRTCNFNHVIHTALPSSSADGEHIPDDPIPDLLDNVVFSEFLKSLSKDDHDAVMMKLRGYRNQDVAQAFGVSNTSVTRRMRRLRKLYQRKCAS